MTAQPERGRARLGAVDIAEALGRPRPTEEQVVVIEAPLEPLLVVAGAGSGKTETMAARVVYLIANGLVEPDGVLGLTFTRKAAGELAERVRHRLRALRRVLGTQAGPLGQGRSSVLVAPTISTYNSYAAGLVGEHALRLGIEPSSRLLGEAARWQLAHDVVERWSADLATDLAPSTVTQAVLDLAGGLAEHLRTPDELRRETLRAAEVVTETVQRSPGGLKARERALLTDVAQSLGLRARLTDLVEEFTARKREGDAIDFADQVALAARLAREVPEVGAAERARFGVVLLDEYQDTSVAQMTLLEHLFGGAGAGTGHPVTAVGDPHQSIYGWRGASAGGLARFPSQFPVAAGGPGTSDGRAGSEGRGALDGREAAARPAATVALATSWRNDHAVLAAANLLAAPLRESSAVDLPVLAARPGAGRGLVEVELLSTVEEECAHVADVIHAAWASGRAQGVTAAVLCRKRAQFPQLQAALVARGLPVEVVGLGGLLGTPEVVDLVAALEAAHDPSRGDSLMRLLTGPRARLGLADLHALADWSAELAAPSRTSRTSGRLALADPSAHQDVQPAAPDPPADGDAAAPAPVTEADVVDERSIVDALDALPAPAWVSHRGRRLSVTGRVRLEELAGVLRAIRAQTFLPVVDLVAEAERLLGLDIEVASRPGLSPAGARANLDAFRSVAASFSDTSDTGTLGAFLAWLDAAQREERGLEAPVADVDPEAVQLMTVHAAKGLEWDVVAVPGLVDGSFPALRTPADGVPVDGGWLTDRGALPAALRGDRDSLPSVDLGGAVDAAELAARCQAYKASSGAHLIAEERRLAYVALTRARHQLLLTGSWWRDGTRPRSPSVFLTEVASAAHALAPDAGSPTSVVRVGSWAPDPTVDAEARGTTPQRPVVPAADPPAWPVEAVLGARHAAVAGAARAVEAAAPAELGPARTSIPVAGEGPVMGSPTAGEGATVDGGPSVDDLTAVAALLLDEVRRGSESRSVVAMPAHLSASAVVRLGEDRDEFARHLRRPVPSAPSTHARRGTDFHAWVERWFGRAALVDVDAMPGADDESVGTDAAFESLRDAFLASPWAARTPVAVEVDIETPVGEVVVRSRIDAVFPDPGRPDDPDAVVVVDWKTGRQPADPEGRRSRELQLAVYRLAWSRWRGVPVEKVDAAFFYVAEGVTVRPEALPDLAELEAVLTGQDGRGPDG